MNQDLYVLRDKYDAAFYTLLDALEAENDEAAKEKIQGEIDKTLEQLGEVQAALNSVAAANIQPFVDDLEERIQAQQALNLKKVANELLTALKKVKPNSPILGKQTTPSLPGNGNSNANPTSIVALPGSKKAIIDTIVDESNTAGLDPLTALTIVAIESDFILDARNPYSSAGGLFQFLDKTWDDMDGKPFANGGGKGNGHASYADLKTQVEIGVKFTVFQRNQLKKLLNTAGPTKTAIYMAHQQGLEGARKLLTASPNQAVEDVIGEKKAKLNRLDGMTVMQVLEKFRTLVKAHEDEVLGLVSISATTNPQTGPKTDGSNGQQSRSLALKAAKIAVDEMLVYARVNGKVITEESNPLHDRGVEYFSVAKSPRSTIVGNSNPWSAAFISFVMCPSSEFLEPRAA